MIEEKPNESRQEYLLRVCIAFIDLNHMNDFTVDYDGTTCDGSCLIEDIENTMDIDE